MRGDYLDWYGANFTAGFKRLTQDGARFVRGAYPYLNTITCAGHATIGTGSFPYRHGMILNNWYDPKTGKSPYCTDDPEMTEISYNGLSSVQGDSAKLMLVPAIGEQVMARGGRSVAFSLKPRSAVTLTGHRSTAVAWFDDRGGWTTSTAFTQGAGALPAEVHHRQPDHRRLRQGLGAVAARSTPTRARTKSRAKASSPAGRGRFLTRSACRSANRIRSSTAAGNGRRSPTSTSRAWRSRRSTRSQLGRGDKTDFLGVSFSSRRWRRPCLRAAQPRSPGHARPARPHDRPAARSSRQDRRRRQLRRRPERGSRRRGNPRYRSARGRVASKVVTETLQKVLVEAMGPGTHVAATVYTNIYLTDAARQRLTEDKKLRDRALHALRTVPGIKYSFWGPELATADARAVARSTRRAAALSHNAGRSGDLIIAPAERWILSTSTTTHGTHYSYDQRVPVLLYGAGVKPGRYMNAATPGRSRAVARRRRRRRDCADGRTRPERSAALAFVRPRAHSSPRARSSRTCRRMVGHLLPRPGTPSRRPHASARRDPVRRPQPGRDRPPRSPSRSSPCS